MSITTAPAQADVDELRGLLDLMVDFSDNDQRARYLLSSNWVQDRGAEAGARLSALGSAIDSTTSNREEPPMTTTTDQGLVFTEPVTYIATPCPPYCDLKPMHPVDNEYGNDGHFRIHSGPKFGDLLAGFAEEYTHAPGELRVRVELHQEEDSTFDDPAGLRQLAEDAMAAAEWLEATR